MKCETRLDVGLRRVETEKKPGMVIIHKTWCGVCKKLKPKFLASKEIERLSQQFVVISLEDDAEPQDKCWQPDGKYFPRVLFLDSAGRIMKEIVNPERRTTFQYFYQNEKSLLRSMERVLCGNGVREKGVGYPKEQLNPMIRRDEDDRQQRIRSNMKCETNLANGISAMRSSRRPGMVVIYKSWCPVCDELKSAFLSSKEIERLSNAFVVVVLRDDAEPTDSAYAPDGGYVPRIFFLAPTGQVIHDVFNREGDSRYKYFYSSADPLIANMKQVISYFPDRLRP